MLDELIEYKEYTDKRILTDLVETNAVFNRENERKQNRLRYINFRNNYSGLKRALRIVAKYFLNKYNQDYGVTLDALTAWAGVMDYQNSKNIQEINEIANYVNPTLINYYLENEATKSKPSESMKINIKRIKNRYKSDLERFKIDSVNDEKNSLDINDINRISFPEIIMSMQNKPIRRNILVCKKDLLDEVMFEEKEGNINRKQKDYILKVISAYLINKKKGNDWVRIVASDIMNWSTCGKDDCNIEKYRNKDNKPLIEARSFDDNKTDILIRLDESLRENYRIAEISSIDVNIGEIVYVDRGSIECLKEHKIKTKEDINELKVILDKA